MSRTIKTNPVLTWPERAQASTGQLPRATEELLGGAVLGGAETVERRDGGTVGRRWDPGRRDRGTWAGRSGAGWIVIIVFDFDLMADQPVCWLAGRDAWRQERGATSKRKDCLDQTL